MQSSVRKVEEWSSEANLVINPSKTTVMMLSTAQLASSHSLNDASINIEINGAHVERVKSIKLLRSYIHEHLKWEENVKKHRLILLLHPCHAQKTKKLFTIQNP
jgi:hypothetical protein